MKALRQGLLATKEKVQSKSTESVLMWDLETRSTGECAKSQVVMAAMMSPTLW